MSETYRIYSVREQGDTRELVASGVDGRAAITTAYRLRASGLHPVVYSERDGKRIYC